MAMQMIRSFDVTATAIPESMYPEGAASKSTRPPASGDLAQILETPHQLRNCPKAMRIEIGPELCGDTLACA
jgi:hypothetical protein